jgi:putative ABC transport system permease protein
MSWRRVFRLPSSRDRLRDELDAELLFHLEGRIEDLMEREGLSRDAAAREAKRRFGDVQSYAKEIRSIDDGMLHRRNRMELRSAILRETRHAFRTLRRTPSFSLIVVLTLGLGLGAATTIFTLLDRVVIRPLPYPDADRMIHLGTMWPKIKAGTEYALSRGQFFYFQQNSRAIAKLGLYSTSSMPIRGDGAHAAERVATVESSASLFDVLGIAPIMGRLFTPEEGRANYPAVALITRGYWERRFGADPAVLGKRIQVGDSTIEIVGVLPASAAVPEYRADIWLPKHLDPAESPQNNHTHQAIGVLAPGVTLEAARADITRLQRRLQEEYPNVYSKAFVERVGFSMNVTMLRDDIVGETVVRTLWVLFGSVAFVLLIAAANVANLFLVRIDARRREMAVRAALGADRAHLAAHYLAESFLITAVAGVLAIGLGYALLQVVLALAPQSLPRLDEVAFDARGIAFCFTGALAFGALFGTLPLLSTKIDIAMLRDGARGLTASRGREIAWRGLVITQVGLAVVLLAGASLMVKSFMQLRQVKPGFDPVGVHTMTLYVPFGRYKNPEDFSAFWRQLGERVEALPGVKRAGFTDALPMDGGWGCDGIGTDAVAGEKVQCMPVVTASPGYFETMGIAIAGERPTWSMNDAHAGPVVVSKSFARRFWGTDKVVGRRVVPFGNSKFPGFPIVGVADDVRAEGLQNAPIEAAYLPLLPRQGSPFWNSSSRLILVIRAPAVDPRALNASVRRIVDEMDSQVPIADASSMEVVVAKSMATTSFAMLLLLISASIALTLSAVGLYGVITYLVGQRRSEIGIRIALGAQVTEVARMVVGQSVRIAVIGAVVGVAGAFVGMRLLQSMLFEVNATDPIVLGGTSLTLILVATLAAAAPARRATKIDPVEAMRS